MMITPHQAPAALHTPDLASDRPQTRAPICHQIPPELQARAQWVLWRYERKNDTWTKVPYQPNLNPAATSRPRTWSTFADAKAAYLARPDYFNGIGYVFSKDDPYCGADFDHCIDDDGQITSWAAAHLAALRTAGAYIEISVSGSGIHAITRATFGKGRKTTRGEIYDRGRFFTISGRALDPTPIGDGQPAIDALRADLGSCTKPNQPTRDGTAGDSDRAALAASHPAAEWEEARQLLRTERDLLLRRSLAATQFEKTHKGDVNQGHYAARLLWPELHQRCPGIGLYRADGSLDDSQARCTLATAIYGRGFSFPQYVVIMSHHFAAYCLAKWGTREMWREELAACWEYAMKHTRYTPKSPTPATRPAVAISAKPRGRASDHAAKVERVYALLQEHRAGAQAIVNASELASTADMHRVTLAGILAELRSAGRISTERNGRYGGLIVRFSDVAIVATAAPELCTTTAETPIEAPAAIEETSSCVTSNVLSSGYSLPTLAELAAVYLDAPDSGAVVLRSRATGESMRRHTVQHFAALVIEHYADHYTADEAKAAYQAEREWRAAQEKAEWDRFFAQLKAMSTPDLIGYIHGGCKREVAELARIGSVFDKRKYQTRLKCAKQNLAWRGVTLPAKPTKPAPAAPTKPRRPRPVACQPIHREYPAEPAPAGAAPELQGSLTDRLRQLKAQREAVTA